MISFDWILRPMSALVLQVPIIFQLSMIFSQEAQSAPFPGTSTSAVIGLDQGLKMSAHGFQISRGKSSWQLTSPKQEEGLIALYRPATSDLKSIASLSVRAEATHWAVRSLSKYVEEQEKTYSYLGFDTLAKKYFTHHNQKAFLIDLSHSQESKQVRQVIFFKDRQAVIITCSDFQAKIHGTLLQCNEIIRSFRWTR